MGPLFRSLDRSQVPFRSASLTCWIIALTLAFGSVRALTRSAIHFRRTSSAASQWMFPALVAASAARPASASAVAAFVPVWAASGVTCSYRTGETQYGSYRSALSVSSTQT